MATRSTISVINPTDFTVQTVYCHFDGYVSNNGQILVDHYTDIDKIISLIGNGDISSLNETVEDTVFYHRDRGESAARTSYRKFRNLVDYDFDCDFEGYDYLYDVEWKIRKGRGVFVPVKTLLNS